MRTFLVENSGCRASQADGAALGTLLKLRGMQAVPDCSDPELIIFNSCTVTATADADLRAAVRKAHRAHPDARILVTGCYAQRAPEELIHLPGVEWVVGNSEKANVPEMVGAIPYHGGVYTGDVMSQATVFTAPVISAAADRARPNLKIQDGCDNRCSFCVIPSVRGNSRFVSAHDVVDEVRRLSERYREVVLTGINLGRWGRKRESPLRLAGLIRRLLAETTIERIRLSSVEPMDWSDELIELVAGSPRVAQHFHMPLQSGSDSTLRSMRRKYRSRHYADRIWKAYQNAPDGAFGADVMTGYPGETDRLFEESLQFIRGLPFTYLHAFTYSERPGTAAASLPDVVPIESRRERTRLVRALSEMKNRAFREKMIGRTLAAVTLEERPFAMTGNYIRIEMSDWTAPNRWVRTTPVALAPGGMREAVPFPVI